MRITKYIPSFVKDYLQLVALRLRYPKCVIDTTLIADGVVIGEGVSVASGASLGPNVRIGNYSYINSGTIVDSGEIGKFCSIGCYCQIGGAEHPIEYITTSPYVYKSRAVSEMSTCFNEFPHPPRIGNDVWIGSHAIITQGVTLDDGAVVGAGSIVTRDVPAYAVVVGSPARVLKYRFSEDSIRFLLSLQWWNRSQSGLRAVTPFFEAGADWQQHIPSAVSKRDSVSS